MAQIAVQPFVLKDCVLVLGEDLFEAHVSQVEFTPSASIQTWQGLTPGSVHNDVTTATWTATLAYAQDWTTPGSLSQYLYENEGEEMFATFHPKAGGPSFAATLIATPGSIGGTVNSFATASVTLACKGKPQLAPVTP